MDTRACPPMYVMLKCVFQGSNTAPPPKPIITFPESRLNGPFFVFVLALCNRSYRLWLCASVGWECVFAISSGARATGARSLALLFDAIKISLAYQSRICEVFMIPICDRECAYPEQDCLKAVKCLHDVQVTCTVPPATKCNSAPVRTWCSGVISKAHCQMCDGPQTFPLVPFN